jgi:hypothetical protein
VHLSRLVVIFCRGLGRRFGGGERIEKPRDMGSEKHSVKCRRTENRKEKEFESGSLGIQKIYRS